MSVNWTKRWCSKFVFVLFFVATHDLIVVISAWFVALVVSVSFGIVQRAWVEFLYWDLLLTDIHRMSMVTKFSLLTCYASRVLCSIRPYVESDKQWDILRAHGVCRRCFGPIYWAGIRGSNRKWWSPTGAYWTTGGLPTRGLVVSRTGHFGDAASTSSSLLL